MNLLKAPAPSISAASFCSSSCDCSAVSRIRVANGSHCQATIRMIGEQRRVGEPVDRRDADQRSQSQASRPETGCISRFFQTSALTVGMTKNGAITIRRTMLRPEHRLVEQQRQRNAEHDGDRQHRAHQHQRVLQRRQESRVGEEVAEIVEPDEGCRIPGRAGCSGATRNRSSSPAGRSSRRTAARRPASSRPRARTWVCWVAIEQGPAGGRPDRRGDPVARGGQGRVT